MEFKTCEEYVLNELNNALTKNEKLFNRLEEMDKDNFNLNEENKKLKRLFKTILKKGDLSKLVGSPDEETFSMLLYSWDEDEKEVIEELKKYIGDEDEENK